jgi:transcriptional regulator of acetoin/glycerol metabolism
VSHSSAAASHVAKVFANVENEQGSSLLIASWRRCLNLHGLRPDGAAKPERHENHLVREAKQLNAAMINAATDAMDGLINAMSDSDHMVFLTDAVGVVLDTRSHRTSDFWERPRGDWAGTDFSEASHGTNGVGTVLRDKRPMTIAADEHFELRNIIAICSGAPIWGSDGSVIGCIDISSSANRNDAFVNSLTLAAAVEAARQIELRMLADANPGAKLVLASKTGISSGVLAVNSYGAVVGATRSARLSLHLKSSQLDGTVLIEELWDPTMKPDMTCATAERHAIEAALARHHGNASAAARALGISRSTLLRKIAESNGRL